MRGKQCRFVHPGAETKASRKLQQSQQIQVQNDTEAETVDDTNEEKDKDDEHDQRRQPKGRLNPQPKQCNKRTLKSHGSNAPNSNDDNGNTGNDDGGDESDSSMPDKGGDNLAKITEVIDEDLDVDQTLSVKPKYNSNMVPVAATANESSAKRQNKAAKVEEATKPPVTTPTRKDSKSKQQQQHKEDEPKAVVDEVEKTTKVKKRAERTVATSENQESDDDEPTNPTKAAVVKGQAREAQGITASKRKPNKVPLADDEPDKKKPRAPAVEKKAVAEPQEDDDDEESLLALLRARTAPLRPQVQSVTATQNDSSAANKFADPAPPSKKTKAAESGATATPAVDVAQQMNVTEDIPPAATQQQQPQPLPSQPIKTSMVSQVTQTEETFAIPTTSQLENIVPISPTITKTLQAHKELLHLLVARTREHQRFNECYGPIFGVNVETPGTPWRATTGVVGPLGSSTGGFPLVGLDCEMVETQSGVDVVGRVSIVAPGICKPGVYPMQAIKLLDIFVKSSGEF